MNTPIDITPIYNKLMSDHKPRSGSLVPSIKQTVVWMYTNYVMPLMKQRDDAIFKAEAEVQWSARRADDLEHCRKQLQELRAELANPFQDSRLSGTEAARLVLQDLLALDDKELFKRFDEFCAADNKNPVLGLPPGFWGRACARTVIKLKEAAAAIAKSEKRALKWKKVAYDLANAMNVGPIGIEDWAKPGPKALSAYSEAWMSEQVNGVTPEKDDVRR